MGTLVMEVNIKGTATIQTKSCHHTPTLIQCILLQSQGTQDLVILLQPFHNNIQMVTLEGGQTMDTEHSRLLPLFHNLICFDQVLTSLMKVVTLLKQTSPLIQNPLIMRSHLLACLLSWTLWYLLPLVMLVIHYIF